MQRIGRAGHQVGMPSNGIIFPKYRADLVACAAVTRAMHEGHVESTRFLRNPLDVLAQQMVAVIAHPPSVKTEEKNDEDGGGISYGGLLALVRGAAPYAGLSQAVFDGVLDMPRRAVSVGRVCRATAAGDLGPPEKLDHATAGSEEDCDL